MNLEAARQQILQIRQMCDSVLANLDAETPEILQLPAASNSRAQERPWLLYLCLLGGAWLWWRASGQRGGDR